MKLHVDTVEQTIELDGVKFAFESLKVLVHPNPDKFYNFTRDSNDIVWVKEVDCETIRAQILTGQKEAS